MTQEEEATTPEPQPEPDRVHHTVVVEVRPDDHGALAALVTGVGHLRRQLVEAGHAVDGDHITITHNEQHAFAVHAPLTATVGVHGRPHDDVDTLRRMREHLLRLATECRPMSLDFVALYNRTLTGDLLPTFPPPGDLSTLLPDQQEDHQTDT